MSEKTHGDHGHGRIVDLLVEAEASGDERKKVFAFMEEAKDWMQMNWGVENLSTIEGVRLRHIVEECLKQQKQDEALVGQGKLRSDNTFWAGEEAPARWLDELYGINIRDIPRVFIIQDRTAGTSKKYEITEKDIAEGKLRELEEQGHKVDFFMVTPDDFKEYLRRIREKAHNP